MSAESGKTEAEVVVMFPSKATKLEVRPVSQLEDRVFKAVADALESLDENFDSDRDREALHCEEAFCSRFGFDAPRSQRRSLLEYKHSADLTDREIRHLRRCGCLKFGSTSVSISAPLLFEWFGWAQLIILGLLGAMAIAAFEAMPHPNLVHFVALAIMLAVPAYLAWQIHRNYIVPRNILRRVLSNKGV